MNIQKEWEERFKPENKKFPKEIVAELLDVSTQTVDDMLRSGAYHFGIARHCAWYEGRLL